MPRPRGVRRGWSGHVSIPSQRASRNPNPDERVPGMTDLLLATHRAERERQCAGTAHTTGTNLLHLIRDLLDVLTIEAGRFFLERIPDGLRRLLAKASKIFRGQAPKKRLSLSLAIAQGPPVLPHGNPHRLRQSLTNLLRNAFTFTATARIAISATMEEGSPRTSAHRRVCHGYRHSAGRLGSKFRSLWASRWVDRHDRLPPRHPFIYVGAPAPAP